MQTWEYLTAPLLVHATKQILDNFGADGWELQWAHVHPRPDWAPLLRGALPPGWPNCSSPLGSRIRSPLLVFTRTSRKSLGWMR